MTEEHRIREKQYTIIFFLLAAICFGIYKEYTRPLWAGGFGESSTAEVSKEVSARETTALGGEHGDILIEDSTLPIYAERAEQTKPMEAGESVTLETAGTSAKSSAEVLNLNTATAGELDKLPGIGPAKAQAIVDYRRGKGGFTEKSQIKNVSGIGESTYQKIEGMITVE